VVKDLKLVVSIKINKELQGNLKVGKIYQSRSARNTVTELLNVCDL
jgi:hypothetical protein